MKIKSFLAAFAIACCSLINAQELNHLYLSSSSTGRIYDITNNPATLTPITAPSYFNANNGNNVSNLAVGYDPTNLNNVVFIHSNTGNGNAVLKNGVDTGVDLPTGLFGFGTNNNMSGSYKGYVFGLNSTGTVSLYRVYPTAANTGAVSGLPNGSSLFSSDYFFDTADYLYTIVSSGSSRILYKINITTRVATAVVTLTGTIPGNTRGMAYFDGYAYMITDNGSNSTGISIYRTNITTGATSLVRTYTGISGGQFDLASSSVYVASCTAGTSQVSLSKTVLSNNTTPLTNELFFEDFGISDINNGDVGRTTTPYMPAGSFQYGSSYLNNGAPISGGDCSGTSTAYAKARINDGYYAVVSPNFIKQGWYSNDCWGSWWKLINDYSGTATGAALVVNAGNNLNAFYNRTATVQVGAKYKASLQLYVVPGNSPTRLAIDVKDAATNAVITTYTTPLYATSEQDKWISVSLEFTMPGAGGETSCVSRNVILSLRNDYAATDGNDYYIDNIKIEKTMDAPACPPEGGCVNNGVTSVNLNSAFTGTVPVGAQLVWFDNPQHNGLPVSNPGNVTLSGTYYAFFYDASNDCYNTANSVAAVTVTIYPQCYCTKPDSTEIGGSPTKVGITNQTKLASWPEAVPNGFIALESKTEGFVITRVPDSTSIAEPKKGMLIYDITAACVKLYNGTAWKCIERSCNE